MKKKSHRVSDLTGSEFTDDVAVTTSTQISPGVQVDRGWLWPQQKKLSFQQSVCQNQSASRSMHRQR